MLFSNFNQKTPEQIIQSIDKFNYEELDTGYFLGKDQDGWYDRMGIIYSLFDLLEESHSKNNNKPAIVFYDQKPLPRDFIQLSQSYNDKDIIYIRQNDNKNHFVVFYFLKEQKKILLIDPLYKKDGVNCFKDLKHFLKTKNYSLYVSTTKIQCDDVSCGPIASEIARVLYNNYEMLEKNSLSKSKTKECAEEGLEYGVVDILPQLQFDHLLKSFETPGTVNYGIVEKNLHGADFRVAHFAMTVIIGSGNIEYYLLSKLSIFVNETMHACDCNEVPIEVREKLENAKEISENIRSTFIGKQKNVALFNKKIAELCPKQASKYIPTERMKKGESGLEISSNTLHVNINKVTLEDLEEFRKLNAIDGNILFSLIFVGNTLFMTICMSYYKKQRDDILEYLSSDKNFNINQVEMGYGNTALMSCCANGDTDICLKLLEQFNADPFIKDQFGKNALHLLIAKGHPRQISVVQLITDRLNIKDHINDQTRVGSTALHLACARRDWAYIELLIKAGASLKIKDDHGRSPLDVLNLSDIERLRIIDRCLRPKSKDRDKNIKNLKIVDICFFEKSIVEDYESYVKRVELFATFSRDSFYEDPNIIKNKINKNIQYNQLTIYFTIAVALSALIITAAFITQTYVILAVLTVPIVIGLYGWSLSKTEYNTEDNIINPDSKLNEVQNKSPMLDGINCSG